MKKTLLLSAAMVATLGASAQTAILTDITPKGYDFNQYEDGAVFKVHAPSKDPAFASYSPDVAEGKSVYDAAAMAADGHFTTLMRRGSTGNDAASIEADNKGLTIRDFGGNLGKCLVFNEKWAPLCSAVADAPWEAGKGPWSDIASVGGNGSFGFGFYADPTTFDHSYTEADVRVKIVYTILRRGRHAAADGAQYPWGKDLMVGIYSLEDNQGGYAPREDGNYGALVTFNGSEYCVWEGEDGTLAGLPTEHVVKSGVGVQDPYDAVGQANDLYTQQLDRFQVIEFDTYAAGEDNPFVVCLNVVNANATVVIKEIKFSKIENTRDLLKEVETVNDDNEPVTVYEPIPGASYRLTRNVSYAYFGDQSGFGEIVADESDAAPVYYNLQGVEVQNPANGLYIVKRGNKVTKEIIK